MCVNKDALTDRRPGDGDAGSFTKFRDEPDGSVASGGPEVTRKTVALISGGLDSVLAARVVMDQGFEVVGLYFSSAVSKSFGKEEATPAASVAKSIGIELRVIDMGQEYIDLIRNPKHGYGRNVNPCIDCKIFMLSKAKAVMAELSAPFIITGEVLGQRPMSQRRDTLRVIERDSGLSGYILRPLSAKHLPPTRAEEEGIIDRERLLDISGRSRTVQMQLADRYGITGFSAPAGGCLLTDEHFAERLRDLFSHSSLVTPTDIRLITVGRHYRLSSGAKVVLGRDKQENTLILSLSGPGYHLFTPSGFPGPVALLAGDATEEAKQAVGRLILKYSKSPAGLQRAIRCGKDVFIPSSAERAEEELLTKVGSGPS
ncbi:MAG TPA: hypothetical protein DCS42_01145 [Nitrospiraceae bacterium]|nr:hypothetical protein [Nitrospiraceae bacterium]